MLKLRPVSRVNPTCNNPLTEGLVSDIPYLFSVFANKTVSVSVEQSLRFF
jgi:hypothetical protein